MEYPPEVLEEGPARDLAAVELLGAGAEPRVVGAALALNIVQSGDISLQLEDSIQIGINIKYKI